VAYTQNDIDYFIGPALDRIAAKQVTFATQTTVEALAVLRHFEQTRDSLIRSYEWPWAETQDELYIISTMTLDTMPTAAWSVADVITGITSGVSATILTVTSNTEYILKYKNGTFTGGETITNATVSKVYWEGIEVSYESETVYSYSTASTYQVNCGAGYPSVSAVTPNHSWTYQYYLPSDFIRLTGIYEDDGSDLPCDRWERQGDRILTDYSTLNITYVKKVTDPTLFEDLFTEVLILRLAHKLINPLAGMASQRFKDELREELRTAEARARVIASQENNTSGYDSFNRARFGS